MSRRFRGSFDTIELASSLHRLKLQGEPEVLETQPPPASPWWPPICPSPSPEEQPASGREASDSLEACSDVSHSSDQFPVVFTHSPYTWKSQPALPGDDADTNSTASDPITSSSSPLHPAEVFPETCGLGPRCMSNSPSDARFSSAHALPVACSSASCCCLSFPRVLFQPPEPLCADGKSQKPFFSSCAPAASSIDHPPRPATSAMPPAAAQGSPPPPSPYGPRPAAADVSPLCRLGPGFPGCDCCCDPDHDSCGCGHRRPWKRLRAKRGFTFFACRDCGAKWRIQHLIAVPEAPSVPRTPVNPQTPADG
eukprot:EG_transcript_10679